MTGRKISFFIAEGLFPRHSIFCQQYPLSQEVAENTAGDSKYNKPEQMLSATRQNHGKRDKNQNQPGKPLFSRNEYHYKQREEKEIGKNGILNCAKHI